MSFKHISGQGRALRMLRGILSTGRIAPAYLFSGERGVGKYSTALEFAKALNCESPEASDSCDECISCRKISALRHPDLLTIEPENSVINVEQIRGIESFLSFTPYEGRNKIVIVDDADMMNLYSENAFLKTLEEPPDKSIIILVSSRQEMLVDTIRSRCLKIQFSLLSLTGLRHVAESIGLTGIDGTRLKIAMGRVGQLLDDEVIEKRDEALDIFENMVRGHELTVPKERWVIIELIEFFIVFLRDLMVYKRYKKSNYMINEDAVERINGICKDSDLKVILYIYELLSELKMRLNYNLNKALVFNYVSTIISLLEKRT